MTTKQTLYDKYSELGCHFLEELQCGPFGCPFNAVGFKFPYMDEYELLPINSINDLKTLNDVELTKEIESILNKKLNIKFDENDNPYVECGFNKWSILYDLESGTLNVRAERMPIWVDLTLGDTSVKDITNIKDLMNFVLKKVK